MRITLKDIARELGMNDSTVSYALSNKGSINEETRKLVKATADRMGYVPNQAARMTSTGCSNTVAIIVPNVLDEYGTFCEHAFRLLSNAGYQTQILVTEFSTTREHQIIQNVIGQNAAGVLLIPALNPKDKSSQTPEILKRHNIPVITRNAGNNLSSVSIDYLEIGKILGEKFRANNRKNIRIAVPHGEPFAENVTELKRGLSLATTNHSTLEIVHAPTEHFDIENGQNLHYESQIQNILTQGWVAIGRKLCRQMFVENRQNIDAVVAPHEACALGILLEAEALNISVPETFDLVSCQKGAWSTAAPKLLSACYVSPIHIAERMTWHLLEHFKELSTFNEYLSPEFFTGETIKNKN